MTETKTEVRLAVIEEKIDNLVDVNAKEHRDIRTKLESIEDNKADKWVEESVNSIDKKLDRATYWLIGLLLTVIGFLFCLKLGWI